MITQFGNRTTTDDIDIVVMGSSAEAWQAIYDAADAVTEELHLDKDWFNDGVLNITIDVGYPKSTRLWRMFGNLAVMIPVELEYILALKLYAARVKDERDIQFLAEKLQITSRSYARAIVHSYIPEIHRVNNEAKTEKALEKFFPEI